jgi:hypothetical protein
MKTRTALVTTTALAIVALVPGGPASADTTVTVHGYFTDPLSRGVGETPCSGDIFTGTVNNPTFDFTRTNPDIGTWSWELTNAVPGEGPAVVDDIPSIVADPIATVRVRLPSSNTGVARLIYSPASTPTVFWEGKATVNLAAGWQTFDWSAQTYTWTQRDATNPPSYPPTGVTGTPSTESSFVTGQGDGEMEPILTVGCTTPTEVAVDNLKIGHTGAVTTYDLEAYVATVAASPNATITAGQPAALSSNVMVDAGDETGAPSEQPLNTYSLVLEQQSGPNWTAVATVPASGGTVTTSVSPATTTTYRWHYLESDQAGDAVSSPFTVTVNPAGGGGGGGQAETLTASGPKKVTAGKSVTVSGAVSPAEPGATVTLYEQTKGGAKAVGTGVISTGGSFSVKFKAKKPGTFTLYASVPATTTAAAATSPTFKVKVKKKPKHHH